MEKHNTNNNEKDTNYYIGIFDPECKKLNPLNGQPYSDKYKLLAKMWYTSLPGYEYLKEIVESIKKNDVIMV